MTRQGLFLLAITVAATGLFSCSTKRNTLESRIYHTLTTKYNLYYNASEAYNRGIYAASLNKSDESEEILAVFPKPDPNIMESIVSEMDVAIEKLRTAIEKHSIKSKPNLKPRSLAQQDFFNQIEFNPAIDNCRLLMGKAQFAKQDYAVAAETFALLIRTGKNSDSFYPGKIWQIRTLSAVGSLGEASLLMAELKKDLSFPANLEKELNLTNADLLIKQGRFPEAIPVLAQVSGKEKSGNLRTRYSFILAQLHHKEGNNEEAAALFQKVAEKANTKQMEFNSWIGMAASVPAGAELNTIKTNLRKMLLSPGNIEFQDQIYFALAEIALRSSDSTEYVNMLKASSWSSTVNRIQKGESSLILADIYAGRKEYIPASAYYDTAAIMLDTRFRQLTALKSNAEVFRSLASLLNTIVKEDSLEMWASLSESERQERLLRIEENNKKAETNKNAQSQQRYRRVDTPREGGGKWYFYNDIAVNRGKTDFYSQWGRRVDEDYWRLKNKPSGVSVPASGPAAISGNAARNINTALPGDSIISQLPVSDSLRKISDAKRAVSYYEASFILRQQLNDSQTADSLLERMNTRFPGNENELNAWYLLMKNAEISNPSASDYYASRIVSKYPDSPVAISILNPALAEAAKRKTDEAEELYQQIYQSWKDNRYAEAIEKADYMAARFPEHPYLGKAAYIRALSSGATLGRGAMRESLMAIHADFPNDVIRGEVAEAIRLLDEADRKSLVESVTEEGLYSYVPGNDLSLVWLLAPGENLNQLQFDLVRYIMDLEYDSDILPESRSLGPYTALIMPPVKPIEAFRLYSGFVSSPLHSENVTSPDTRVFLISEKDLQRFSLRFDIEEYMSVFTKEYIPLMPQSY